MSTSTPYIYAVAGQVVSQIFVVILFLFIIGLLLSIWISGGTAIWAALQFVKDKINQWIK